MNQIQRNSPRLAALALSLLTIAALHGQTSRGTVTGLVTDATKAAIPNASVEVTSASTGVTRTTSTNDSGIYRIDAVDPGLYSVVVKAQGFRSYASRAVPVQAAQVSTVDALLEIGETSTSVEVTSDAVALQTEAPVRGGTISSVASVELPNSSQNPNLFALTLPGVTTSRYAVGTATFVVNGSRGRSNNFLLDGTENNDISVAGQAFQVTNPDAVQEVSVQTSNYDAEFGRAGGAVVNTITKSGTNQFHGTARFYLDVTNDDAITSLQAQDPAVVKRGSPPPGTEYWAAGTVGGPIIKDRTFFFGSYQEHRYQATGQVPLVTLSGAGLATLNSVFAQGASKNADLYRQVIGSTLATGQFFPVALGNGRPSVQFGTALVPYGNTETEHLFLGKVDHKIGERDQASMRYGWNDQSFPTSGSTGFPGFFTSYQGKYNNALITETHVFSPSFTNEARLSYNRIDLGFPANPTNPLGLTTPRITISSLSSVGLTGTIPQGRIANNYVLQDTMSWVRGSHTFRFGFDLLDQRARQFAPFSPRGQLDYRAGGGFTGFANFVDDFAGSNGAASKDFGSPAYFPTLIRQAYFVQDRWRVNQALTLTLGLRYENFGTPVNSVRTPVYTGLFNVDPTTFTGPFSQPNKADSDNNNFAPTVGIAYAPSFDSGMLGTLFGQKKSVVRMGYQIGYDSFFNNIASNAASSSPNIVSTQVPSPPDPNNPRGLAALSTRFPSVARPVTALDTQTLVTKHLLNPYYQRWSVGVERELPGKFILDVSYVGTKGSKLFVNEDANPLVPASLRITPAGVPANRLSGRLDNLQGARTVRTNAGSSIYHAGQLDLNRQFANGLLFRAAYTYSKLIDNGSEVFALGPGTSAGSLAMIPAVFNGQRNERAVSLFDRTHRAVFTYVYELPFYKSQKGFIGHALGGWQVSGVTTFETGVPFTVFNGVNAKGFGSNTDRPNLNPAGQARVRAVPDSSSPTGYVNPDQNNAPIDPKLARYIGVPEGSGIIGNAGRNTERIPGINNFDASLQKEISITERIKLQFRAELYNVFNHPQFGSPSVSTFSPGETQQSEANSVFTSPAGQFLDPTFLDSGGRVIRYQLKIVF